MLHPTEFKNCLGASLGGPTYEVLQELSDYVTVYTDRLELTDKGAQYLAGRPTDLEERYRQLADRVTELERRLDAMVAAGR
jgi:hypothetical protein